MSDSPSVVPTPPNDFIDPLTLAHKEVFGEYVSPAKWRGLKTFGVNL